MELEKKKEKEEVPRIFVFGAATEVAKGVKEWEEDEKENEKEKDPKLFAFGEKEPVDEVLPMSYYSMPDLAESVRSQVLFKGRVVTQVGEGKTPPEPVKISFLHRLGGQLQFAILGRRQTLAGWARQCLGMEAGEVDGYFTTKGGRILNSQAPVAELGLHPTQEVVLQVRLRGGGYSGGRGGGKVLLSSARVLGHP